MVSKNAGRTSNFAGEAPKTAGKGSKFAGGASISTGTISRFAAGEAKNAAAASSFAGEAAGNAGTVSKFAAMNATVTAAIPKNAGCDSRLAAECCGKNPADEESPDGCTVEPLRIAPARCHNPAHKLWRNFNSNRIFSQEIFDVDEENRSPSL